MDNLPMFEEVVKVLIDCPRRLLFHKVKVLQRWSDSQNCHVIPEIKENNAFLWKIYRICIFCPIISNTVCL